MRSVPAPFRLCSSLALGLALGLAALPGRGQGAPAPRAAQSTPFGVLLSDDGGLDTRTARTLRALTVSALRKRGETVSDDPAWEGLHPTGAETQAFLKRFGGRALSLRVAGRLGTKLPLALEELRPDGTVATSAWMTAASLEECDIVIPRLVEALLSGKTIESTAQITTVTTEEARPFQHRPGEGRFVIGMLDPLFSGSDNGSKSGLSLGYMYEAEHFMLGVEGLYFGSGNSHLGSIVFFQGAWLPLSGEFSPYLGGGVGYLGGQDKDISIDSGVGCKLTAGLEMFRLHRVRLQVGVDVYFPSSTGTGTKYHYQTDPVTHADTSYEEQIRTRSSFAVLHVKLAF